VDGLRIEDFRFEAADATMPGESSIGALVVESSDVVLRRVRIEAGVGWMGKTGTCCRLRIRSRRHLTGITRAVRLVRYPSFVIAQAEQSLAAAAGETGKSVVKMEETAPRTTLDRVEKAVTQLHWDVDSVEPA
jgi:hypothetical protein